MSESSIAFRDMWQETEARAGSMRQPSTESASNNMHFEMFHKLNVNAGKKQINTYVQANIYVCKCIQQKIEFRCNKVSEGKNVAEILIYRKKSDV